MKQFGFVAVPLLLLAAVAFADLRCRFAPSFATADIFSNPKIREEFLEEHAAMETNFMKTLGIDPLTQMTRDGHRLSIETGLPYSHPHMFSAPSKESVHVAVLAKVLDKSSTIANKTYSIAEALDVLQTKVTSFERFHSRFPGFGGFFPWVAFDGKGNVTPTWDWQNRVPALDNGELFWAAFAVSHILNRTEYRIAKPGLAERWFSVWQNMVTNCVKVFYAGNGNFRTVTNIANQLWPVSNNSYTGDPSYLDDPYEGELFTVMAYLFSNDLNATEKELLWIQKRPLLQAANLSANICRNSTCRKANITTQRGWWFSAHEQWKYLMLPYRLSPTNGRVFENGERARTWYARFYKHSPGLWASVNGPIDSDNMSFPYYSDCGIGPLAFQNVTHDDVVTPYGAFPLFLASAPHGAAWFHHMILTRKGQNCYGTTEGFNVSGTAISPIVTWDSKITTLVATTGGLADLNKGFLQQHGKLEAFVSIVETEWSRVFTLPLSGEDVGFQLPDASVPAILPDFSSCNSSSPACAV